MHVVHVPLPNADGLKAISASEVQALVRLIQRTAAPLGGQRTVTLEMLASALGVSRGTLYSWMRKADRRRPGKVDHGRGIPYPAFYCLQVMATNPAALRDEVFSPMWARTPAPILPRTGRAPGTP